MGAISYNAVELYDRDFGPHIISVAPPGVQIAPTSTLKEPSLGKVPARLTQSGWSGVNLHDRAARCLTYDTAKLWDQAWGANIGFVAGEDGYLILDNDQGEEFTESLLDMFDVMGLDPLRRYVLDAKHKRDAFLVRVLDFVGDGVSLSSRDLKFRRGNLVGGLQLLASGKQAVISGTHRDTKSPYVLGRPVDSIRDIPILSERHFDEFLEGLMVKIQDRGWMPVSPVPPKLVSPVSPSRPTTSHKLSSGEVLALILEARDLLDQIPNRDVPAGETPNDIDQWLDPYENWIKVAYTLGAYLGDAAQTPEAEALFSRWSDGRSQTKQSSQSLWRSVIRQPLTAGITAFPNLVRSLTPREADFPPFDPNDPDTVPPPRPVWDRVRKEWAFFNPKDQFLELSLGRPVSRQGFSDTLAHLASDLADELAPGRKRTNKLPSIADLFTAQPDKLTFGAITYAPGDVRVIPVKGTRYPTFNKWRPTSVSVKAPVSAQDVQPWLDHVEFVTGSIAERDRFVKWSAFVAQHPELKPNWHFLILSLQGVGKDTMVEPVKVAVGDGNWREEQLDHLAGTFNVGAETKLIIVSEVGQPKSREAHRVDTVLKQVLAKPPDELWVNQKNTPIYKIPNRLAAILFSNEATPVSLERDQRRLHVLNCRNIQPKPPSYYQGLRDWYDKGGVEKAAAYLLSYTLSDADLKEFIGGTAPSSVAKSLLEQQSVDPYQDALEELIRDARDGIGAFTALVAQADQLAEHIGLKMRKPTPLALRGLLLDMESRNTGVRRLRIDPKNPTHCGVVAAIDPKTKKPRTGRLWVLAEQTADGRDWGNLTHAEVLAIWKGEQGPPSATVLQFPDPAENDEII